MKKILGMTMLAATVGAAGLAWAAVEAEGPGRPGRGEARFKRMAEYLGLSEEQQATWKSLHEQQTLPPPGILAFGVRRLDAAFFRSTAT